MQSSTLSSIQSSILLRNPTPQHLEVTSLGVVGGVGVIAAGAGAIEDLEALLVAVRGLADEVLEGLRGDESRAGAGDEESNCP